MFLFSRPKKTISVHISAYSICYKCAYPCQTIGFYGVLLKMLSLDSSLILYNFRANRICCFFFIGPGTMSHLSLFPFYCFWPNVIILLNGHHSHSCKFDWTVNKYDTLSMEIIYAVETCEVIFISSKKSQIFAFSPYLFYFLFELPIVIPCHTYFSRSLDDFTIALYVFQAGKNFTACFYCLKPDVHLLYASRPN